MYLIDSKLWPINLSILATQVIDGEKTKKRKTKFSSSQLSISSYFSFDTTSDSDYSQPLSIPTSKKRKLEVIISDSESQDNEFDFSTPQSLSIQKKETNQMKKKTKSSSSKSQYSITFKENANQNLKTMSLSSLSSLLFTEDSNLSLSHPQSQDLISTDLNSKKRSSKSIQSIHDCLLFYHSSSSGSILLSYAFCSWTSHQSKECIFISKHCLFLEKNTTTIHTLFLWFLQLPTNQTLFITGTFGLWQSMFIKSI